MNTFLNSNLLWFVFFIHFKIITKSSKTELKEIIFFIPSGILLGFLMILRYFDTRFLVLQDFISLGLLIAFLYKSKMYPIKIAVMTAIVVQLLTLINITLSMFFSVALLDLIYFMPGHISFLDLSKPYNWKWNLQEIFFQMDFQLLIFLIIIFILLTILFYLLTRAKIIVHFCEKIKMNMELQTSLVIILVLFYFISQSFLMLIGPHNKLIFREFAWMVFWGGLVVATMLFTFIFYAHFLDAKYQLKERENENKFMQIYVNEIENQYTQIRKFRHDYQNILISLESFIVEEEYEELKNYYNKIKKVSQKITENNFQLEGLKNVKIKEIKSILTIKLMMAQDLGIELTFEACEQIDTIPINSVCLIRMIGIILDNAIEELIELGNGTLLVALFKDKEDITFIASNSCRDCIPNVQALKELDYSTKGRDRGLGLSNLSELALKYPNVLLETIVEEGQFIQKIIMQGE